MNLSDALHNPLIVGSLGLSAGSILGHIRDLPKGIASLFERFFTCSIEVSNMDDEETFNVVRKWMSSLEYAERTRNLTATFREEKWNLTPAPGNHFFWFAGRPVWLNRHRDNPASDVASQILKHRETITVRVMTRNKTVVRQLCENIERHHRSVTVPDGQLRILTADWSSWGESGTRIARPLDSVILPNGEMQRITSDLERFWSGQAWYESLGVPYRRGWLLHGVPGSGKTSLVSAIAGHYKRDVYILNLSEPGLSDAKLLSLLARTKKGSIVLLEDVDAAFTERSGKSEDGITFGGLLNALDGIASPEGIVLFMTTNHPDKLDPALIRPGRIDKTMEFHTATDDQLRRLYRRFVRSDAPPQFIHAFNGKTVAEAQVYLLSEAA